MPNPRSKVSNPLTVVWVHNASTYSNWGCRCPTCRAAHAALMAQARTDRAERLREDPTLVAHGLSTTYTNWGCRCPECTRAHTQYRKSIREKRG